MSTPEIIKLNLHGNKFSFSHIGDHQPGDPVVVVANEDCMLTFDDPSMVPNPVRLTANVQQPLLPNGQNKSTFTVTRLQSPKKLVADAIPPTIPF